MKMLLSCLLASIVALLIAHSSHGEEAAGRISAEEFASRCAKAVLHHREGAGGLSLTMTLLVNNNNKYPVHVYKLNTSHPDTQYIDVWIGKGKDTNVEIPRVTDICLDGGPDPDSTTDPSDIIFYSKKGHTVPITFHLSTGLVSTWKVTDGIKTKPSDSIWMKDCKGGCTDDLHPNRSDWPSCMTTGKDQSVTVSGNDLSFALCSNSGQTDEYKYELHTDQMGIGQIKVDVAIDPQIINHAS